MGASQETIRQFIDGLSMDVEVREDYSGRGMYGATCLAIVRSHEDDRSLGDILNAIYFMGLQMDIDKDDTDAITAILRSARMDSMGLDTVIYFPAARTHTLTT